MAYDVCYLYLRQRLAYTQSAILKSFPRAQPMQEALEILVARRRCAVRDTWCCGSFLTRKTWPVKRISYASILIKVSSGRQAYEISSRFIGRPKSMQNAYLIAWASSKG